jgi:hypothetical protein
MNIQACHRVGKPNGMYGIGFGDSTPKQICRASRGEVKRQVLIKTIRLNHINKRYGKNDILCNLKSIHLQNQQLNPLKG